MNDQFNRPELPSIGILSLMQDEDRALLSNYGEFIPGHPGGRRSFFGPDKVKGTGVRLDPREGFGKLHFEKQQLPDSNFFGAKFTQLTDERPARMGPAQARRSRARLYWSCLLLFS